MNLPTTSLDNNSPIKLMEILGSEVASIYEFYCYLTKRMRKRVSRMLVWWYLPSCNQAWQWHLPFLDDVPLTLLLGRGIPRHVWWHHWGYISLYPHYNPDKIPESHSTWTSISDDYPCTLHYIPIVSHYTTVFLSWIAINLHKWTWSRLKSR